MDVVNFVLKEQLFVFAIVSKKWRIASAPITFAANILTDSVILTRVGYTRIFFLIVCQPNKTKYHL